MEGLKEFCINKKFIKTIAFITEQYCDSSSSSTACHSIAHKAINNTMTCEYIEFLYNSNPPSTEEQLINYIEVILAKKLTNIYIDILSKHRYKET